MTGPVRPVSPEQQLIGRTWRRIWWQTSAVVAVAVLAVAAAAAGLVLTTQHSAERQIVQQAMNAALAGTGTAAELSPPAGVWVYQSRSGTLTHSFGAPATPPDRAGLADESLRGNGSGRPHEVELGDREYLVDTRRAGAVTVQVALDLTTQEAEQHRLYFALGGAGLLGLALAVGAGVLIARRAIRPLGVAFERQQRFVADASHELRTPITQLHLRAQILARSLDPPDPALAADPELATSGAAQAARDARQLVRGARLLGDIVEEMLLAAQLRSEPARFGPVELDTLVAEVVAAHADQAGERDVELTRSVDPGSYVVRGTPGALRRTVSALVDNALTHTPAGGHVVVRLDREPRQVVCQVRDDGVGFDPADTQRIFERFARGGYGEGRRFGLGLALVREAVEAHGGTVTADSVPGQGATFTLRLPAWEAAVDS